LVAKAPSSAASVSRKRFFHAAGSSSRRGRPARAALLPSPPCPRDGLRRWLLSPLHAGSWAGDDSAFPPADFDRYLEQHGIPEADYPAAFALWIAQHMNGRVPRFEKVEREPRADGVVIKGRDQ
jgi:hypothetical protein